MADVRGLSGSPGDRFRLCGMLPMYRRVAEQSPHGQGSIAMVVFPRLAIPVRGR